jgi:hypothetical protein
MKLILTIALAVLTTVLSARDTLRAPIKKNIIYAEALGNNFISGGGDGWAPFSLNYSRKTKTVIFNLGVGTVIRSESRIVGLPNNPHTVITTNYFSGVNVTAGFMVRFSLRPEVPICAYRRNGLWFSLSGTIATGSWHYTHFITNHPPTWRDHYHDVNYNINPGLCYQFQSRNERLMIRGLVCMKFYADVISDTYDDYVGAPAFMFGLCAGYGF